MSEAKNEYPPAPGSAVCDNCGHACLQVVIDSTLYHGDRKFAWGVDCPCGKRRWNRATTQTLCQQCATEQGRSSEWDTFHYGTNRRCDACDREGLCAMMPTTA